MYSRQKALCRSFAMLLALLLTISLCPIFAQGAEAPLRGNLSGNLINTGFFAQDGEWLYYYDPFNLGALTKAKTDGSEKQMLTERAAVFINVADGWVYFVNDGYGNGLIDGGIFRVRTDGSDLEPLYSEYADHLTLEGDWLHFHNFGTFYRIRTDGSDLENIGRYNLSDDYWDNPVDEIQTFWDGYWYYTEYWGDEDLAFTRLEVETGKAEILKENCEIRFPQVHNGKIYFWEPNERVIYRSNLDGSAMTVVYRGPSPTDNLDSEDGVDVQFFQVMDDGNYICMGNLTSARLIQTDANWKNERIITRGDIFAFGEIDGGAVYIPTRTEGKRLHKDGETTFFSDESYFRAGDFIAEYDGWVYFVERDKSVDSKEERQYYLLYRARSDGSEKTLLSSEAFPGVEWQYAQEIDDIWVDIYHNRVYYPDKTAGLRSATLSGHDERQHLRFIPYGNIISVIDGWVYYFEENKHADNHNFLHIRVDGTDRQMLSEGQYSFAASSYEHGTHCGHVYKADENGQAGEVHRYAITESGRFVAVDSPMHGIISVSGEKVIYENNNTLMIYDAETGETAESPLDYWDVEGYYREWFYLSDFINLGGNTPEGTWRMRYDGSGLEQISNLESLGILANERHLFISDYDADPIDMYALELNSKRERIVGQIKRDGLNRRTFLVNDHIYIVQMAYDGVYTLAFDGSEPLRLASPPA